jgi:ketosteroid isomerase-like protein
VPRENIGIVRAVVDGLERGDLDSVRGSLDPALEWHPAEDEPEASVHTGVEAVLALWAGWRDAFDGFRASPLEFVAARDCVVVPIRFRGKPRGSATETTIEETHVYRLRDGRVVEVRSYRRRAAALEALGLSR